MDEDPVVRRAVKASADRLIASAQLEREIARSITEAALLARYNRDVAGKPGPEEVHVRAIMVPTEGAVVNITGAWRGGGVSARNAKRLSKEASAPAGGDVGFVVRDTLTPEVAAVVFTMQPGQ